MECTSCGVDPALCFGQPSHGAPRKPGVDAGVGLGDFDMLVMQWVHGTPPPTTAASPAASFASSSPASVTSSSLSPLELPLSPPSPVSCMLGGADASTQPSPLDFCSDPLSSCALNGAESHPAEGASALPPFEGSFALDSENFRGARDEDVQWLNEHVAEPFESVVLRPFRTASGPALSQWSPVECTAFHVQ